MAILRADKDGNIYEYVPPEEPDATLELSDGRVLKKFGHLIDYGETKEEGEYVARIGNIVMSHWSGGNKFEILDAVDQEFGGKGVKIALHIIAGIAIKMAIDQRDEFLKMLIGSLKSMRDDEE